MTTRNRWDETRALIEAGWHSGWGMLFIADPDMPPGEIEIRGANKVRIVNIDWDDTKQAQHDAERQIYGGLGTPQRED